MQTHMNPKDQPRLIAAGRASTSLFAYSRHLVSGNSTVSPSFSRRASRADALRLLARSRLRARLAQRLFSHPPTVPYSSHLAVLFIIHPLIRRASRLTSPPLRRRGFAVSRSHPTRDPALLTTSTLSHPYRFAHKSGVSSRSHPSSFQTLALLTSSPAE